MPIHRHLHRGTMCRILAGISRTWNKLSYPRYVIQAENILNPERLDDIDNNFSRSESVIGFLSPKPIDRGIRLHEDARLIEDQLGRPHPRATRFCDTIRRAWNEDIAQVTAQIYRIMIRFDEPRYKKPRTFRSHGRKHDDRSTIEVIYDFLRTVRGKGDVTQIQRHNESGIGGLQRTNDRLTASANVRAVDRRINEILQENHTIQYGP